MVPFHVYMVELDFANQRHKAVSCDGLDANRAMLHNQVRRTSCLSHQIGSETSDLQKMRSIEEQAHEDSTESAGDGDCKEPCEEEEADSLEIDGLQGAVAEADTHSSTSDAHRGRDGKRILGEDEHGDGGTHFHRASSTRRMVCDLVTHDC